MDILDFQDMVGFQTIPQFCPGHDLSGLVELQVHVSPMLEDFSAHLPDLQVTVNMEEVTAAFLRMLEQASAVL